GLDRSLQSSPTRRSSDLEQLFAKLRRNDLVTSVRGPGGGYRLGRDAAEISVAQVVDAVNESLDTTRCNKRGDCQNGDKCLTHDRSEERRVGKECRAWWQR